MSHSYIKTEGHHCLFGGGGAVDFLFVCLLLLLKSAGIFVEVESLCLHSHCLTSDVCMRPSDEELFHDLCCSRASSRKGQGYSIEMQQFLM